MSDSTTTQRTLELNAPLLGSGVILMGVGGVLWLTGAAVAAFTLAKAAKKWIDQLDESPADIARRRMHQMKVAASAGSKAWREQST